MSVLQGNPREVHYQQVLRSLRTPSSPVLDSFNLRGNFFGDYIESQNNALFFFIEWNRIVMK